MATIYVRSTDGSNSDSGATWALAKADLTGAAAIDAAGDTIYLSQSHAESTASALSFAIAADNALVRIICGNDAAEPPTAKATTASITSTGNSNITFLGSYYLYGVTVTCASGGTGSQALTLSANGQQRVEIVNCALANASSGNTAVITISTGNGSIVLENTTISFGHVSQKMSYGGPGIFRWAGGGLSSGTSAITTLVAMGSVPGIVELSGLDLSYGSSSMNIFSDYGSNRANIGKIRNCKLPASWSGSLTTGSVARGSRYEMHNCDSADTNYRMQVVAYAGSIVNEQTVVRTGGASDGTTSLSWKMVSNSSALFPVAVLDSGEIVAWNETTGSSLTATVEVVTDNVTLKDDECWLEVQYLGTSGYPIGSYGSDVKSDLLATAASQTSSSETWTTTGLTTPVKQKLSVTFTPQEKGFIHAVVKLAKASTTVYVDPKLTVA